MSRSLEIFEKYPSIKKLADMGDDAVEFNDGREEKLLKYIKERPDFAQMHNDPVRVLNAIDEFSCQEDFLISVGPNKANVLAGIIKEEKPRVLVEMGGYLGYSAILFADQMRRASEANGQVKIWSLEFETRFANIAAELIALAGLSDHITIVTGPADESIRRLKAERQLDKIDFLFLDHVEDLYEQELKTCLELELLNPGSCIVADNVVRPGAPKYRAYVRHHPGLESRGVKGLIVPGDFEDEFEVTKVI